MQHSQKSAPVQPSSHRRSLHRTLSDESIYRGQRLPSMSDSVTEPTLGSDVLFSCSTLPRSPTTRGVPLRRPSYKLGVKLHGKNDKGLKCLCLCVLARVDFLKLDESLTEPQKKLLKIVISLFSIRWPFGIWHVIGGLGWAPSWTPPTGADAPPIFGQGQSPGMDPPGGCGQYLWDWKKHTLW